MIHRVKTQPIIQSLPECLGVLHIQTFDTFSSCVLTDLPASLQAFIKCTNRSPHTHTAYLVLSCLPFSLISAMTSLLWIGCLRNGVWLAWGEGENGRSDLFFFFFSWQTGFLALWITFVRVIVSKMGVGRLRAGEYEKGAQTGWKK